MNVDKGNLDDDGVGNTVCGKCKTDTRSQNNTLESISTITSTSLLPEQKNPLHILDLVGLVIKATN